MGDIRRRKEEEKNQISCAGKTEKDCWNINSRRSGEKISTKQATK